VREITFKNYKAVLSALALSAIAVGATNYTYGLSLPEANDTITANPTDTLKSITSNVLPPIQSDVDKIISDTMDIQINNIMNQLSNATLLGSKDTSVPKFETKVPSGIDVFDGAKVSHVHHD
jgi:hypothetical protein